VKDSFYKELELVFDKFHNCHMLFLGDYIAIVCRQDKEGDRLRKWSLVWASNRLGKKMVLCRDTLYTLQP
jgi:hypothetical protein